MNDEEQRDGCCCDRTDEEIIYIPPSPDAISELTDEDLEDVLNELDYVEQTPGVWVKLPSWVRWIRDLFRRLKRDGG